ncbi:unnamed protein product, partial [Medioppia subpectinata]
DTRICTDTKPEFISTRNSRYQTLDCTARLCTDSPDNGQGWAPTYQPFNNPVFEWNCQLGHIQASNGTCDYDRHMCWHSVDIDLHYFQHRMRDNDIQELRVSCAVSDAFLTPDGSHEDLLLATGVGFTYIKSFEGKGLDEQCSTDTDCRDNMFCLLGADQSTAQTYCQCRMDYAMGVAFVRVLDNQYQEWSCAPPLLLNESCLYDAQCSATDPSAVCQPSVDGDGISRCRCGADTADIAGRCQPIQRSAEDTALDNDSQSRTPAIIWWIFTDEYQPLDGGVNSRGYFWLRWAAYLIACLAIVLPLLLLIIATMMLCHRRALARRAAALSSYGSGGGGMGGSIRFPAPKLVLSDLKPKKCTKDDKYNLVENDQLGLEYKNGQTVA